MKDSSQPSGAGPPPPALGAARGPETDSDLPRPEQGGRQHSGAEVEPLTRSQQEPVAVQDKLLQVATREKGAAAKPCGASQPQAEGFEDQEKQAAGLAKELESREAELRRRDAFYKEQLGRLEKQNVETYRLSSQQFHEAASKMEGAIKPRRLEPVCSGLQAQILHCYRDHLQEVLLCADLVKAYQHCVSTAHKG
nr:MICOS complex subunit MIC25 isoform X2 [Vicugna pacos]